MCVSLLGLTNAPQIHVFDTLVISKMRHYNHVCTPYANGSTSEDGFAVA